MKARRHSHSSSGPVHSPLPSQTHHPSTILVPTPALVESVAGAAHYSGIHVDPDSLTRRRGSAERRPSQSGDVQAQHQRVLNDLKELYGGKPTPEIFDRTWNPDAIFEGPLFYCEGYAQYASQWYALAKLCAKSETTASRVLSSTSVPNRIVYSQTQEYTLRLFAYKRIVRSIIVVDLDDDDKIVRLVDQWDGQDLPTRFGTFFLRRVNAKLCSWLFSAPSLRP